MKRSRTGKIGEVSATLASGLNQLWDLDKSLNSPDCIFSSLTSGKGGGGWADLDSLLHPVTLCSCSQRCAACDLSTTQLTGDGINNMISTCNHVH